MLPKAKRLTTEDVGSLDTGRSVFGTLLSLRLRPSKALKCSVSVSKKVAPKAVDRNRARRRAYAAAEKALSAVKSPAFMLIMLKKEALAASVEDIAAEISSLLERAGL
ncbi:MAG: ribonuclease P protein component [Candidatus Taylorbacteria bacterium]|nr:ribonuclease P protein component [Candidatus Taylorbacteria bacterium]